MGDAKNGKQAVPFDQRVVRNHETGCLEWIGGRIRTGYGRLRIGQSLHLAHRVAYQKAFGPIPEGLYVCHKCDNPPCCEPTHLFLGTQAENMSDRLAKGNYVGSAGVKNGASKLNDHAVRQIRKLYVEGMKQVDLAAMFGITQSNVSLIVLRKKWQHIT